MKASHTTKIFNRILVGWWMAWATLATLRGQEPVQVWEFAPYRVQLWYAFDTQITTGTDARQVWLSSLQAELERTFRAAWRVELKPLPSALRRNVLRDFDSFDLARLQASELVLVVSQKHADSTSLRSLEAVLQSPQTIACTGEVQQQLAMAVEELRAAQTQAPDSLPTQLLAKCQIDQAGHAHVAEALRSGELAAALIPRWRVAELTEIARLIPTPLPWQTESLLRQFDKLFFLVVSAEHGTTRVKVRELDCPMQSMGPAMSDQSHDWWFASHLACSTTIRAFAPVARVEDASSRTAQLRLRAGGLILDRHNPANIVLGDVLQPIIRRDDRNGLPVLLEPLPWTYAAVTASDGVKLEANVYTYSGGPGLQGRQNRRTQRTLLRVRPTGQHTDIELLVRGNNRPQSGCSVYLRDLLSDEFEWLGRTDWRGRITIPLPEEPLGVLPDQVRYERLMAKKEAEKQAALEASSATDPEAAPASDTATSPVAEIQSEPTSAPVFAAPTLSDPAVVVLRAPLTQVYIKHGETVLAKLPLVVGLAPVASASLPDDERRLKTEAFVRGFQEEILDIIGLRRLLAARIQALVQQGKREAAQATLEELRQMKNYTELADRLEVIQRQMLDENAGPVSMAAKNQIDRMFQSTRDLLQKHLQDNLLSDSERAVASP